jgi:transcriptional regulator with XRE-family HTH domain
MTRAAVGKKLKDLRYEKNLTLKDVSGGTGISISMLSKIEREETTPTIDLAIKLATYFNLSLAEMINIPEGKKISITRLENLLTMNSNGGLKVQFFNKYTPDVSVDFFKIIIPTGTSLLEDSSHPSGSHHVLYFDSGEGVITISDEEIPVAKGDVISFYSDVPHNYRNEGKEDLIIIGILTYK